MPTAKTLAALAPLAILGAALLILLFVPTPAANRDVVVAVISGLLGYVAKPEKTPGEPS